MSGPLRVALEETALQLDAGGSARALRSLRAALEARGDVELVGLRSPAPPGGPIVRGLVREAVWMPLVVGRRARALGARLLHCPVPVAPVRPPLPLVVTAMDALPAEHPEWFTRANVVHHRLIAGRALRAAAVVLCPTADARDRICAAHGVDPGRTAITPLGVDERMSPGPIDEAALAAAGIHRPYLLTVGTLQPRKNVEGVLRAFEALHRAGAPHQLVVAGARGWHDGALASALRASPAAGAIRLPGRVDDAVLVSLYRGADAFVFPSRGEGFGLPPLEAMACGAPVVCSDRTSLPEVVGDAAVLVDPDDPAALEAAVHEALDPARARELRARGRARAATFTWSRCAEGTVAAYRRALGAG